MQEDPATQNEQAPEAPVESSLGPDGKVLKKTFEEIREEARRDILSGVDREKYEQLEPDEREFVDQVCLFESKSQKVSRQHHKVKLREILLCRDIATAYCPGHDPVGQYSEGKRILKNSETGSDSVKFVLARKVCSMLDKINTIYSSNAQSYVRGDLHRMETDLLNYLSRLGRMIKDPLSEARRVYSKLRERAGWNLPNTAFAIAEDCDVPQIFFNRYSSPAQLLLKDPKKPFRSDNVSPPLKLDFRIKNAVLIVAGENRFHLDRTRFEKVKDTPAARQIARASLQTGKDQIAELYRKNPHDLKDGFSLDDDTNVQSIKENSFGFFFSYTLKNLPSSASRADAVELFMLGLIKEENDLGCLGFCRYIYPPAAVDDPMEPPAWNKNSTRALQIRRLFHDLSERKIRLSMFPSRMNLLLTDHLDVQFARLREKIAEPYRERIAASERELRDFLNRHGSPIERETEGSARLLELETGCDSLTREAFEQVAALLKKEMTAAGPVQMRETMERVRPRLEEKITELRAALEKLRKNFETLVEKKRNLSNWLVQAINLAQKTSSGQAGPDTAQALAGIVSAYNAGESAAFEGDAAALVKEITERRVKVIAGQERVKAQFDQARPFLERLKQTVGLIGEANARAAEIGSLRLELVQEAPLREREAALRDELGRLTVEFEEKIGHIEEAIEVNKET